MQGPAVLVPEPSRSELPSVHPAPQPQAHAHLLNICASVHTLTLPVFPSSLSPLPLSALGGALQSRGPKSASLTKHPRMAVRQPAPEFSRVLRECRFPGTAVNLIKVLSSETGNLHFKQAP